MKQCFIYNKQHQDKSKIEHGPADRILLIKHIFSEKSA